MVRRRVEVFSWVILLNAYEPVPYVFRLNPFTFVKSLALIVQDDAHAVELM